MTLNGRPTLYAFAALALALEGCTGPNPDRDDPSSVGGDITESFPQIGEIVWLGFDYCPPGFLPTDGRSLPINDSNAALFSVIGTAYGGDGTTSFNLPDLRGRMPFGVGRTAAEQTYERGYYGTATVELDARHLPAHAHRVVASAQPANAASPSGAYFPDYGGSPGYTTASAPTVLMGDDSMSVAGAGEPVTVAHPYLVMTACIANRGYYPQRPSRNDDPPEMYDRNIADLMMTAGSYCPSSFITADGVPIDSGGGTLPAILYALIGTTYGGSFDAFDVPDLQGRSPVGANRGSADGDLPELSIGEVTGTLEQSLTLDTLPSHTHRLNASTAAASSENPEGRYFASFAHGRFYEVTDTPAPVNMSQDMVGRAGSIAAPTAFSNLAPVVALNMCLAYNAEFPQHP